MTSVALVHDYLTQRGGAERVVLEMARAFPDAALHTSIYEPSGTFDDFADVVVEVSRLQRLAPLRRHHRLGLPLYAPAFSTTHVDADVVLCSSSGWAHGVRTDGRKVGYLHTPARWLHQADRYTTEGARGLVERAVLWPLSPPLRRWDRRAIDSLDALLCNSRTVAAAIDAAYGRPAEVLPPPPGLVPGGPELPVVEIARWDQPFVVCVARLVPYKNVDAVIAAAHRAGVALVVVGAGPEEARLRHQIAELDGGPPTTLLTYASDAQLRWLYRHAAALVAVSYEDYGLTPLEAAAFGTPSVALHAGGYLDTITDGVTGVFVEHPDAARMAAGLERALGARWDAAAMARANERFEAERFRERLREAIG